MNQRSLGVRSEQPRDIRSRPLSWAQQTTVRAHHPGRGAHALLELRQAGTGRNRDALMPLDTVTVAPATAVVSIRGNLWKSKFDYQRAKRRKVVSRATTVVASPAFCGKTIRMFKQTQVCLNKHIIRGDKGGGRFHLNIFFSKRR